MLTYIKQETRVFRRLERVCNEFRGVVMAMPIDREVHGLGDLVECY